MKRVFVTGGNKGIGLESTKLFVNAGFEVIVVARSFDKFPEELNDKIKKIVFDLEQVEKISELVGEVGEIDILINNAGVMHAQVYDNYHYVKKKNTLRVNLESPVELITQFSEGMIKKGKGRIVNVASIAGHIGHKDVWYGITKAGVINFTKSFSKLLGPSGIVVNCVAPSPVDTDMLKAIPEDRKKTIIENTVLNRLAKPDEIAKTIFWLATNSPDYINGICVDINNTSYLR